MRALSKTCAAPRRRRLRVDLRVAGALLLWLCSGSAAAQMSVPELGHTLTRLETPVVAPPFELSDMDGQAHALADYRGKVVMINFWATWCPPCRREMPSMEAVHQALEGDDFAVLAINQWETPDMVFPWIGQLDVFPTFPILFDREGKVAEAYGVKGLPTTVLVDRQGRLVYRAIGGRDFNHPEVTRLIRELMQQAP